MAHDHKISPAIFLLGPTASGKSELAVELAQDFPLEIVSVDSAQVYRCMDIGTAKPGVDIRRAVPHHLIDIVWPAHAYSAGQFRQDALKAMHDIASKQKIPLLVGGTMLYFKALREGLSELPSANPELRAKIDSEAAVRGWPEAHRELAALDPDAARRIDPNDSQRIQRALEVCRTTGRPFSEVQRERSAMPLPYRVIALALQPAERAELHRRIASRFSDMLQAGLIEEVRWLRRNFELHASLPAMRCVGYRQVWQYLEGEYDRRALEEKAVAATRQLAKRQLTWLRAMRHVKFFDCFAACVRDKATRYVQQALALGNL
jgi:tRNA dimethylallyltransferase